MMTRQKLEELARRAGVTGSLDSLYDADLVAKLSPQMRGAHFKSCPTFGCVRHPGHTDTCNGALGLTRDKATSSLPRT
jgi:hypothetical protein